MLKTNKKHHIHLLPVVIFMAVLTLSIKVNNVFDLFKHPESSVFDIAQSQAFAEEKNAKETAALTQVLNQGASANTTTSPEKAKENAFSQSEILILQELAERREALDIRAKEIDKRAIQLKVTEDEIEKKLQQLKSYEKKLEQLITQYNEKEQEKLSSLVKLYSAMKPKDAARIFNTLDTDISVSLLRGMKPAISSAIVSQMESDKAKAVTSELIGNNI